MSPPAASEAPRISLTLILLCFILSGISGLIYQAVWSQYLGLILGHAAYAQSLVLATFMGGMAVGAWVASRYIGRATNLLRVYGLLEGVIGLFGLAFHGIFLLTSNWLFEHWLPIIDGQSGAGVARYLVALALILPQTILLGMTFPVMSAGLIRWRPETTGRTLGSLYFLNSIGAAGGALLATFVLVPNAGLPGAMTLAGILNLVIAAAIVLMRTPTHQLRAEDPMLVASNEQRNAGLLRMVLSAAFVTGTASFMYEIGWVRMLSLALGSSLHTFELMLAAFIGGLAFGGFYIRKRLDGLAAPMNYLGWVQVLMGVFALATLPLYDQAFDIVGWIISSLAPTQGGYVLFNFATAAISILIMFPAAFFAGMTLPLMTYALLRNGVGEKAIGWVYAANTLGAILGVLLMVHLALPLLGLKLSMVLAAAIDIGLGLLIMRRYSEDFQPRRYLAALILGGITVAVVMSASQFDPRKLASGVYRTGLARLDPSSQIEFMRDGKTASIALYSQSVGSKVIATNGKPDASLMMDPSKPPTMDEPTMIMAGLLALAYHPDPQWVANIGFGSGLTTHTIASSSVPKGIVTVEIEPAMVAAARGFGDRVAKAYTDPRSLIIFDDARAYFSGGGKSFDVIISEPSNPWVSGVAKLFSQEFYEFVPRHLKPGGILVQWVQAYEMSDQTLLSILAALDSRFADYAIYTSNRYDLLIVASPTGALKPLHEIFTEGSDLTLLATRVGIGSVGDLRGRLVATREMVRAMLEVTRPTPNSDYFPTVAHHAPLDRFMNEVADGVANIYASPGAAMSLLGLAPVEERLTTLEPHPANALISFRRAAFSIIGALTAPPGAPLDPHISASDLGDIQLLRVWGSRCFAHADVPRAIGIMTRLFRSGLMRVSMSDAEAAWVDPSWVQCQSTDDLPVHIAGALRTLALAFDPAQGKAMLDSAATLITQAPPLSADTLADFYALAMVGAARARLPDEVRALHAATRQGVPMLPVTRIRVDTVAQAALTVANGSKN